MKSFPSRHAEKIWDHLYTVLIPDQLTLSEDYLRVFGTHLTGDAEKDKELSTTFTTVMIPIARILEYYEDGLEIQIPDRKDMIQIHKSIEEYLDEWKDHIKYDINTDTEQNKRFVMSLEKLSRDIYNKANRNEVINNMFVSSQFGIVNPFQQVVDEEKESRASKPNYQGISDLIRKRNKPPSRF